MMACSISISPTRIDIVLVDSGSPFGTEALLPRGTLREPPKNLRRASYILLTKCNGNPNDELITRIRRYNRTAEIIECTHGPIHLENVFTRERQPLDFLKDKWVGAISAIAVPEAFEGSLEKLGARVEIRRRFSDHHRFSRKDVDKFMQRCVERDMEIIVTTEKDAVRFPRPASIDVPVLFPAHRSGDPQRPGSLGRSHHADLPSGAGLSIRAAPPRRIPAVMACFHPYFPPPPLIEPRKIRLFSTDPYQFLENSDSS